MNIGIDIDDTITDTYKEIDIWAEKYTKDVLKREFKLREVDTLDPMWAKHMYNWSDNEDKEFWNLYYESVMQNVKPKENAVDIINELSDNNKIIIITARWDRENKIIQKITKKWLEDNKIKYDKLFIGHLDKRNIVKENNIDIFIDDSYKTCKEISQIGVRTFIMNSRINKDIKDNKLERVFSWKEIKEKLMKEVS